MNLDGGTVHPFVFAVGCPRSGTTLLQRMLDAHPQLAVVNDSHFITRSVKRILKKDGDPQVTDELVDQVLAYRRFRRIGLDEDEVRAAAAGCKAYGDLVAAIYSRVAAKAGKRLSGEKTPDFCRQIPQLRRLCPRTRFIHIIRDGRDTMLSTLNWARSNKGPGRWALWNEDPVATCALWWSWQAGLGIRDGRVLPESDYLEVVYEQLVTEPAGELERIAAFLGIGGAEQMARFHVGKTKSANNLSAKSAWLPPTSGLRDWRTQAEKEDVAVFEGLAGGLLERLGYPLSGYSQTLQAKRRIERSLNWWAGQKMARGFSLAPAPVPL